MPRRSPAVHVTTDAVAELDVDALVVPVFRGAIEAPGAEQALQAIGLDEVPRDANFRGRLGEVLDLAAPGQPWGRVTLVGLGRMDELSPEVLRRAAGSAVRSLAPRCRTVATTLVLVQPGVPTVRAVAEGALLGAYRFDDCRPGRDPLALRDVTLVVPSSLAGEAERQLHLARVHAAAQNVARDLVSTPPNLLGPVEFADRARELVPDAIDVEVWDEDRLVAERCGGLLAVGRGSARPSRLVRLHHRPASPVAKVALVGKGITFDTGGLSLKRPSSIMESMKGDMGGAGAVLGVFTALAELDVAVEVVGYLCLAENMPGGDAQRPSDVITIRDGTTVEVMNTDAEGRLVLADGLSLAVEDDDVEAVVDVATLTGAVARALGKRASGVFANDDDLLRQLLTAAEGAGESMWHLPLWEDLRDNLESDVADLENLGRGDEAGATMGGLFLREFVDGRPWAHLDIAGPFWQDADRHHNPRHGTGVAVRTLLRWLEQAGR
ncbi:leucyl aminopeptidase [Egicoccus halophilus]|uniref:Probable cytosol aminopeptidase n=1 Tax=Egicoccus halophilus TaxID=1670830 RepID=A0A8J3A6Y0_9ACTN|nr:leucyl aminopeptidase [Egicoccus halophilus]GGI04855.1 putative cytosol aminopeptidase [Egicoccus halophilus]